MVRNPIVVLTIGGSDSCAGAGVQADLKTFGAMGVYGLTVVTAVVAETPLEVATIHPLPPAVIQDQLRLLLGTYPVSAVKTGMLHSAAQITAVADLLAGSEIPLVVDPVMMASTGDPLHAPDGIAALASKLIPHATLITPNFPEAKALLGASVDPAPESLVEALGRKFGCAVLLTGGHTPGDRHATDLLWDQDTIHTFRGDWINMSSSHGTGCTLSAAITAGLALGLPLREAVQGGKRFVTDALLNAHRWTSPRGEELIALDQTTPHNLNFD